MGMVTINCERCGKPKQVREADRKRGWGRFCSKRCKAVKQSSDHSHSDMFDLDEYDSCMDDQESGWDAHKTY